MYGFKCAACGDFTELDSDADAPRVQIKTQFVEGGDRHTEASLNLPVCEDCRPGVTDAGDVDATAVREVLAAVADDDSD